MGNSFRAAIESGDAETVSAVLHPEVVFRSPAVFAPYVGRDATMTVLRAVLQVFENFSYVDEIANGSEHVLRFVATVDGKSVDGVDILSHDDAGLVTELTVMIRPLSALVAVVGAMRAQLEQT